MVTKKSIQMHSWVAVSTTDMINIMLLQIYLNSRNNLNLDRDLNLVPPDL